MTGEYRVSQPPSTQPKILSRFQISPAQTQSQAPQAPLVTTLTNITNTTSATNNTTNAPTRSSRFRVSAVSNQENAQAPTDNTTNAPTRPSRFQVSAVSNQENAQAPTDNTTNAPTRPSRFRVSAVSNQENAQAPANNITNAPTRPSRFRVSAVSSHSNAQTSNDLSPQSPIKKRSRTIISSDNKENNNPELDHLDLCKKEKISSGGQGSVYLFTEKNGTEYIGKSFRNAKDLSAEDTAYKVIGPHPNIVKCYGSIQQQNTQYLILEKINGPDLTSLIAKLHVSGTNAEITAIIPQLTLMLTEQFVDALKHIEESGLSHSDIKPENILITQNGKLKLIDFGVTKQLSHQVDGNSHGTHHYTAPEVLTGQIMLSAKETHRANHSKADSYSAANVILELLTGYYLRQNELGLTPRVAKDTQTLSHILQQQQKFETKILPDMADGWVFPDKDIDAHNIIHSNKKTDQPDPTGKNLSEELYRNIISPLQEFLHQDRSSIRDIHPIVKKMARQYLTEESKRKISNLLQTILTDETK